MASQAEERIRLKVEASLRGAFPEARIIHELVLRQGGVRIDLAAVTPDRLICAEVKSERDVLTRLPEQVEAMKRVADAWCVVTTEKHLDKCRRIAGWLHAADEDNLERLSLWRESLSGTCNAPARLDMLWADELRWVARIKGARWPCITAASDTMTGAQVRRAVCSQLRARAFPRADAPISLQVFGQAA
jgi:hypothetical protein